MNELSLEEVLKIEEKTRNKRFLTRMYESLYKTEEKEIKIYSKKIKEDVPSYVRNSQRSLHHPFYFNIIDTKASYIAGNAITINVNSEEETEDFKQVIKEFKKVNDFEDLELEACRKVSTCGYCGRLFFITAGNEEREIEKLRVVNIDAWNTIVEYDFEGKIIYSIRLETDENDIEKVFKIFQYTENEVITYSKNSKGVWEESERKFHNTGFVPFFKIQNNNEEISDIQRAKKHIEEYDQIISDYLSEMKAFRNAIMTVTGGANLTRETIEEMKKTGVLSIPGASSDANKIEIKWLIKDLPTEAFQIAKETIKKSIFMSSQHVDFQELSNNTGNLTNINITTQLMPLESKAAKYQNKLIKALNYQFKLILKWTNLLKLTKNANYRDLTYVFNFMKPINMLDKAQEQKYLDGLMSNQTRLAQYPSITDTAQEIKQMEEDKIKELKIDNQIILNDEV